MLSVNLITVGKLKESYLRDAEKEYAKRLQAFCKLKIVELDESRLSDNPSQHEILSALSNEAKSMAQYTNSKNCYNIAMCIEGKQFSSPDFSKIIEKAGIDGKSVVNIFIGSSFGLDELIKNNADLRLSMSKMTFPHQLARVMFLEQLYRAFQIMQNGKYHK